MKKNDVIEGIVQRVVFPNKGIVETSEGKVVVKGVLPDQKVSVQIQKIRKDRAEGRLLDHGVDFIAVDVVASARERGERLGDQKGESLLEARVGVGVGGTVGECVDNHSVCV